MKIVISNLKIRKTREWIATIGITALAALREIFDENAYARYLEREQVGASRESYQAFQQEMVCRRERRARCC